MILRNVFCKKIYNVHMISAICEMYLAHLCTLLMKEDHLEPHFLLKWFGINASEIKCPPNYIGLIMYFVAFQRLCTSWVSKTWIYGKAGSLFQEFQTNNNFIGFRLISHSEINKTEILLRYGIYFWEALRLSYITILDIW